MWKIYGKTYDLELFLDKHPGGRDILECCKGKNDLTPAFESYHAMCDLEKIKKIMKKYEISDCQKSNYTFYEDGFYKTLQKRVRKKLLTNYKSNTFWVIKSIIQTSIFFSCFTFAFYFYWLNPLFRVFFAALAGHMFVQIGFSMMHDASHFAISHNKYINMFLTSTWNSFGLWDYKLWMKHHVFRHHSFTGNYDLDPDTIHFKPLIQKSNNLNSDDYLYIFKLIPKIFSLFTISIFPGMYVGQSLLYNIVWLKRGYLWKMVKPTTYKLSFFELVLKCFSLFSLFYYFNIYVIISYGISLNITYAICILPDHDMYETYQNKISDKNKDWGEIQVRNSGNFLNQSKWFSNLFGGINYQIEHHLFPTICHVHFDKISPIVKKTCKEFEIPYVHTNSLLEAISSTLRQYADVAESNSTKKN